MKNHRTIILHEYKHKNLQKYKQIKQHIKRTTHHDQVGFILEMHTSTAINHDVMNKRQKPQDHLTR